MASLARMATSVPVRLVYPHQLFTEHLDAPDGTTFVLVEHDLLFRQYGFHSHKLVLHRASTARFAARLHEAGHAVELVGSDGRTTSRAATGRVLADLGATEVSAYDVVDDWLSQDVEATLDEAGLTLGGDAEAGHTWLDTPNFLATRDDLTTYFGTAGKKPRMQHFYAWQRRRLDVLVESDEPVGGKWSFDEDNRKKLPKNHPVPDVALFGGERDAAVEDAVAWVAEHFPDAPGDPVTFAWPTTHREAEQVLEQFLEERFTQFGPYEDAVSTQHPFVFHGLLTPGLNIGLLSPALVLERALAAADEHDVDLPSVEGFVRQVIGWREYMRATYVRHGRQMRSRNHLGHGRPLADGWWTAETGLDPVDAVLERVLERGYAHHIERLMVLGNAMCLLRTDPDAVYEWFMEMFVDAYDWVMVPNVYAMSQFATGEMITTKPYVSGSNYLKKMTDFGPGEWREDWDALYWTFVRDHLDVFTRNPRSSMIARSYEGMDPAKKAAHSRRAAPWLG
ncbi:(6-4) photolyase [Nocardioides aquaticus]|uniref:(6-4) photolyase n=2 Tax=Nocardioides aquaticus TaxID=160826 RepID=A0ABX8EIH4_9ACTN|nr:(6-4) photolyase [Nocardioides aquaticus]